MYKIKFANGVARYFLASATLHDLAMEVDTWGKIDSFERVDAKPARKPRVFKPEEVQFEID